jgi:hypothetical protein
MYKTIDVYNPNCYSLFTDDVQSINCLKRVFKVYDYINDNYINIYVCAEYYRLLYGKYSKQNLSHSYNIENLLSEAIGDYVPLFEYRNKRRYLYGTSSNSFENISVPFTLLERPYTLVWINILDCFKIILDNSNKALIKFKEEVAIYLYEFINEQKPLKKDYKTRLLISEALGININQSNNYTSIRWSAKDINENSFLDLVVLLTEKYTTE